MKITFFDSVSDQYGSSRMCRLIMQVMHEAGNDVEAYVSLERLPITQRYAKTSTFPTLVMTHLRKDPIGYFRDFASRFRSLKATLPTLLANTDIVYCNTLATLPVAWCSKKLKIPTVLHLHETANSPIMRLIGRFLLPRVADQIICVSGAVAKSWKLDRHPSSIVVHNGIPEEPELEKFKTDASRPYDLCFVGRLTEKKGIGFLLSALKMLNLTQPPRFDNPFKVVIAGGTLPGQPIPPELEHMASGANVQITYLGEIDDTREVFLQSKVACVPSLFHDPFPTVVLEAMRAGCAVVASELGGAREALANAHGELIKPGDVHSLVDAIVRQRSKWTPDIVTHNQNVFNNQFTLQKFRERLLSLNLLHLKSST